MPWTKPAQRHAVKFRPSAAQQRSPRRPRTISSRIPPPADGKVFHFRPADPLSTPHVAGEQPQLLKLTKGSRSSPWRSELRIVPYARCLDERVLGWTDATRNLILVAFDFHYKYRADSGPFSLSAQSDKSNGDLGWCCVRREVTCETRLVL